MAQTLIEIAKTVVDPFRRGVIETVYTEMTFMQYVIWRTVQGLALPYNQEESLPAVGFRNLNEAFSETTGVVNRKVETMKPFGADSDTDVVLVDAYGNEERVSRDSMHAKAMAVMFTQYALYGNSGARTANAYDDVKGFDGIMTRCTSGQVVDGGGVLGSAGSSVFAIRFGDGYVQALQTPQGLDAKDLGEQDSKPVYRTRISQTGGLAIFNGKAVGMIQNLESALCNLTCAMMNELRDKVTGRPTVYLMSSRSRRQLMASAQGLGIGLMMTIDQLGNPIESWNGVPIIVDDCVIDTEVTS